MLITNREPFKKQELRQIIEAMWIARDEYGKTDWSEIMSFDDYKQLQEKLSAMYRDHDQS